MEPMIGCKEKSFIITQELNKEKQKNETANTKIYPLDDHLSKQIDEKSIREIVRLDQYDLNLLSFLCFIAEKEEENSQIISTYAAPYLSGIFLFSFLKETLSEIYRNFQIPFQLPTVCSLPMIWSFPSQEKIASTSDGLLEQYFASVNLKMRKKESILQLLKEEKKDGTTIWKIGNAKITVLCDTDRIFSIEDIHLSFFSNSIFSVKTTLEQVLSDYACQRIRLFPDKLVDKRALNRFLCYRTLFSFSCAEEKTKEGILKAKEHDFDLSYLEDFGLKNENTSFLFSFNALFFFGKSLSLSYDEDELILFLSHLDRIQKDFNESEFLAFLPLFFLGISPFKIFETEIEKEGEDTLLKINIDSYGYLLLPLQKEKLQLKEENWDKVSSLLRYISTLPDADFFFGYQMKEEEKKFLHEIALKLLQVSHSSAIFLGASLFLFLLIMKNEEFYLPFCFEGIIKLEKKPEFLDFFIKKFVKNLYLFPKYEYLKLPLLNHQKEELYLALYLDINSYLSQIGLTALKESANPDKILEKLASKNQEKAFQYLFSQDKGEIKKGLVLFSKILQNKTLLPHFVQKSLNICKTFSFEDETCLTWWMEQGLKYDFKEEVIEINNKILAKKKPSFSYSHSELFFTEDQVIEKVKTARENHEILNLESSTFFHFLAILEKNDRLLDQRLWFLKTYKQDFPVSSHIQKLFTVSSKEIVYYLPLLIPLLEDFEKENGIDKIKSWLKKMNKEDAVSFEKIFFALCQSKISDPETFFFDFCPAISFEDKKSGKKWTQFLLTHFREKEISFPKFIWEILIEKKILPENFQEVLSLPWKNDSLLTSFQSVIKEKQKDEEVEQIIKIALQYHLYLDSQEKIYDWFLQKKSLDLLIQLLAKDLLSIEKFPIALLEIEPKKNLIAILIKRMKNDLSLHLELLQNLILHTPLVNLVPLFPLISSLYEKKDPSILNVMNKLAPTEKSSFEEKKAWVSFLSHIYQKDKNKTWEKESIFLQNFLKEMMDHIPSNFEEILSWIVSCPEEIQEKIYSCFFASFSEKVKEKNGHELEKRWIQFVLSLKTETIDERNLFEKHPFFISHFVSVIVESSHFASFQEAARWIDCCPNQKEEENLFLKIRTNLLKQKSHDLEKIFIQKLTSLSFQVEISWVFEQFFFILSDKGQCEYLNWIFPIWSQRFLDLQVNKDEPRLISDHESTKKDLTFILTKQLQKEPLLKIIHWLMDKQDVFKEEMMISLKIALQYQKTTGNFSLKEKKSFFSLYFDHLDSFLEEKDLLSSFLESNHEQKITEEYFYVFIFEHFAKMLKEKNHDLFPPFQEAFSFVFKHYTKNAKEGMAITLLIKAKQFLSEMLEKEEFFTWIPLFQKLFFTIPLDILDERSLKDTFKEWKNFDSLFIHTCKPVILLQLLFYSENETLFFSLLKKEDKIEIIHEWIDFCLTYRNNLRGFQRLWLSLPKLQDYFDEKEKDENSQKKFFDLCKKLLTFYESPYFEIEIDDKKKDFSQMFIDNIISKEWAFHYLKPLQESTQVNYQHELFQERIQILSRLIAKKEYSPNYRLSIIAYGLLHGMVSWEAIDDFHEFTKNVVVFLQSLIAEKTANLLLQQRKKENLSSSLKLFLVEFFNLLESIEQKFGEKSFPCLANMVFFFGFSYLDIQKWQKFKKEVPTKYYEEVIIKEGILLVYENLHRIQKEKKWLSFLDIEKFKAFNKRMEMHSIKS